MKPQEKARKLRPYIEKAAQSLDDIDALEAVDLYPEWSGENVDYEAGIRLRFGDKLYKVLQPHTSQKTWSPDVTPSLYALVFIPDPEVIPDWIQPDSTNPYMKGDKVKHNGKTWESLIDNNIWEPGVVGTETLWAEINS